MFWRFNPDRVEYALSQKNNCVIMNEVSSRDLVGTLEGCARGEHKALRQLYQHTSAKLFAVILRILKDRHMAEDCLQQVYIKIWQAAGSYSAEKSAPMTWMNTVARNQALDLLRKQQREPGWEDDALDLQEDKGHSQESLVEASQTSKAIHHCLKGLDERQRQCLEMSYFDGFTHQGLADHLDVPLGTVKTWIRRGLIKLKECMTA